MRDDPRRVAPGRADSLFFVKHTLKSMNTPQSAPLSFEIAAADLEAARRFLMADLDLETTPAPRSARPGNRFDRKTPTCHQGINRARVRSASRAE